VVQPIGIDSRAVEVDAVAVPGPHRLAAHLGERCSTSSSVGSGSATKRGEPEASPAKAPSTDGALPSVSY